MKKLKEKTKLQIFALFCTSILLGIHWAGSAIDKDSKIEKVKADTSVSQEIKNRKIASILNDYSEVSNLCLCAISIYSVAICGYIYFDRRERE